MWSFNSEFPNVLYKKVSNFSEYIEAIHSLKSGINIKAKLYDDILDYEIYPFDGDEGLWKDYFTNGDYAKTLKLSEKTLKKVPSAESYPVIVVFQANYKALYWIPIN